MSPFLDISNELSQHPQPDAQTAPVAEVDPSLTHLPATISQSVGEWVKYHLLPRADRMRQYVLDTKKKRVQEQENMHLAEMAKEIKDAQSRLMSTQGGMEALRAKLANPYQPQPAQMTFGDAAGFGLGLLAGQGGARSAAYTKASMDTRAAGQNAVDYANYQRQGQIDAASLDDLRGQYGRQSGDVTDLQRELMRQSGAFGIANANADYAAARQDDKQTFDQQMQGQKQMNSIELERFKSENRAALQQASSEHAKLISAGFSPKDAQDMIASRYGLIAAKIIQTEAQTGYVREKSRTESELRKWLIEGKKVSIEQAQAYIEKMREETRFIEPKHQLEYSRVMSGIDLAERRFEYSRDDVSRKLLVEEYKSSRAPLNKMLDDANARMLKAKAAFAANPEDESAQQTIAQSSMTIAEIHRRLKAIDEQAQKLGREKSTVGVKKNSSTGPALNDLHQRAQKTFGPLRVEQWADRDIRGRPGVKSKHATGGAYDLFGKSKQMVDVAQWLATQPQTSMVIHNRMIWTRAKGWHKYTGANPHTDHIHLEAFPK